MTLKYTAACLIFLLAVLGSGSLKAQDRATDSLKVLLSKAKSDSARVEVLNKLSFVLGTVDADKALAYGNQSIALAKKAGFKRGLAHALNNMGILYDQQGKSDSALVYYKVSVEISRKIKNIYLEASCLSNTGYVYWNMSDYKKALDYTFKALAILDTGTNYTSIAGTLEHAAMIYYDLKDYKNSIKFHRQAIEIYTKAGNEADKANVYCNMALNYLESSKDSMVYYLKKGEAIFLKYNDNWALGHVYNNIGGVYVEMKKPDPALVYLAKARQKHIEMGDDRGMVSTNITFGVAWLLKDKTTLARNYIDTAIAMSVKMDMKENLAEAYRGYALVYARLGALDSVTKYLDKEQAIKDTVFSSEKTKAIADMQTKYDTEKKDLEIARNRAELTVKEEQVYIKNIIIAAVLALLVLLAISGSLFYRKKQIEQKANHEIEMARQKDMRSRSVIEAEEKERIRIASDLHDGVGQLLSAAKLNLSSLESQIKIETPEQEMAFKNALSLVDDSVKEVRAVSHNMMPNTLLKLGLASAVKEFVTKIQGTPNLKINLEIVGLNGRLEQEKETVLYRVIQEVVANIIRHSKASELTLQIIRHEKELSILIEDNGVGFDTSRINDFEGIGLKNIISRIEFINGTVHFDSVIDRGTTVIIELALASA